MRFYSLVPMVTGADAAKLQVAVHAIGDAANDLILTIYDEIARTKTPGASEAPHS